MSVTDAALLSTPLFVLVLLGWLLVRVWKWSDEAAAAITRFVFTVALPASLFSIASRLRESAAVDPRLLLAYFGGCLAVFVAARVIGRFAFGQDGVAQSVFGTATVYSNNVMVGVPFVHSVFGEPGMGPVAMVLLFNSLLLWSLGTFSVEFARRGRITPGALVTMTLDVVRNPVIASILAGAAWAMGGLRMPGPLADVLSMVAAAAAPLALIAMGMGLARYRLARSSLAQAVAISALKLAVLPALVWALSALLGLPVLETQVITLLASMSVGVNAYLMAREFDALQAPVAASLVISTLLSALSTPAVLLLSGR